MNETKAVLYNRGICINTDAGLPHENPDLVFRMAAEYFGVSTVYVLDCETKIVYTYSRKSSIALDELMKLREILVYTEDGNLINALIDVNQLDAIVSAIDDKNTIYVKYPIDKIISVGYNTYEVYGYKLHDEGFISYIYTRKCTCEEDDAIELFKCHWRAAR